MGEHPTPLVLDTVADMQDWSGRQSRAGRRVGLVPTMGNLHAGHLSLLRMALAECDSVVVSIFVNPSQFGPGEDFDKYPRSWGEDLDKLRELGESVVFAPSVEEIYPGGESMSIDPRWGMKRLCAASRPGHFAGVCNVVARLFNAVLPQRAYFGQKDAQQALFIHRLVRELHFPIELRLGATEREAGGLARSSRNDYLDAGQRERAGSLNAALAAVGAALAAGQRDTAALRELGLARLAGVEDLRSEYFELVQPDTLNSPTTLGEGLVLVALAARMGATRLIDNHVYRIEKDGVREALLF